jgi:hypothetical protein
MARDDFKPKIKDSLAKRVGHACSNPDCDVLTVGPHSSPSDSSSIGVAAHIAAASEGGPRWDSSMTKQDRTAPTNGIWLCHACARKIDNDPDAFPVDLLLRWKQQAEEKASKQHGRKLLRQADVQAQMGAMLGAAPTSSALAAISNVNKAAQSYLASLDRRLDVRISSDGSQTCFDLAVKEEFDFKIKAIPTDPSSWIEQVAALQEHGRESSLNVRDLVIEGSPLLSELTKDASSGVLQIQPIGVAVEARLRMLTPSDNTIADVALLSGRLTWGSKTATAAVEGLDGLLRIQMTLPLGEKGRDQVAMKLEVDTTPWEGRDIRLIRHFDLLRGAIKQLSEGSRLEIQLHANGSMICRTLYSAASDEPFIMTNRSNLHYIACARSIAEHLNVLIPFRPDHAYSAEEFAALDHAANVAEGRARGRVSSPVTAIFTLTADADMLRKRRDYSFKIQLVSGEAQVIAMFGIPVSLPRVVATVTGLVPELPTNARLGEPIEVTWGPSSLTEAVLSFESASSTDKGLLSTGT